MTTGEKVIIGVVILAIGIGGFFYFKNMNAAAAIPAITPAPATPPILSGTLADVTKNNVLTAGAGNANLDVATSGGVQLRPQASSFSGGGRWGQGS